MNQSKVLNIVQNSRRRELLNVLNDLGGECSLREAVRRIAEKESDGDYDSKLRKSILVSLTQTHLPKMERLDIIDYDKAKDTVRLQEVPTDLRVVLEVVEKGDIPWSVYYLFLSLLGLGMGFVLGDLMAKVISSCFLAASVFQMFKSPGNIDALKRWFKDVEGSIATLWEEAESSLGNEIREERLRKVVLLALSVMSVGVTLIYYMRTTYGFILLVIIPLTLIIYNESMNIYAELKEKEES